MEVIRVSETAFLARKYPGSIVMLYNIARKSRSFLVGDDDWEKASKDHKIEDLDDSKELLLYYMVINAKINEDLKAETFLDLPLSDFFNEDREFFLQEP